MDLPNLSGNVTAGGLVVVILGIFGKIMLSFIDMLKHLKGKEIETQPELRRIGLEEQAHFRELLTNTLGTLTARLTTVEARHDECEKRYSELDKKYSAVESQLADIRKRLPKKKTK